MEACTVRYKTAKKVDKKVVAVAKSMTYDILYLKLDTKEGEKEVFKLARVRERRTRDSNYVKCIKDKNDKVLAKEAKIKDRWQRYFAKLLNGEVLKDFWSNERESSERQLDYRLCESISKDEIKNALKKMSNGKDEGPDQIPIEVWKCLDEEGLK